jgi:WD40 repeat protein
MAESTWGSLQVENNLDYRVDYINVSRFVGDNLKHVGEIEGINNNCSYDDSIILPDNLLVVHCGESNLPYEPRIELWDLEKMEKINSQPTDKSILTLIDSPDGDIVVGSDWDGSTNRTKIWEIPSLKELPKPDFMGSYQFLESSLNNEYFWGENYYGVFMYKFSNGNIIDVNDEFPFNQIEDGDFAFNEDNSIVAFFDPREDTITVWDRVNNKEIIKIKNSNADGIILSPKGDQLIVSNWNGNIVIKKKKITLGKGQVFGINPHQFFNLVSMVCQSRQSIFN